MLVCSFFSKAWLLAKFKISELYKDEGETIELGNDLDYYKWGYSIFFFCCVFEQYFKNVAPELNYRWANSVSDSISVSFL